MKARKFLNHFTFILAVLGSTLTGRMTAQTFKVLHTFTNSPEAAGPEPALLLSSSVFYGTTTQGGLFGYGTVFRINPDGTSLTNLHSFTAYHNFTNNDGAIPTTGVLALSGNVLYGTTIYGGTGGNGTVFSINTDGTDFTNLHSFTATVSNTNSDGSQPQRGVIIIGNTLYGTTTGGGSSGSGALFAINTDGTGFTNLYNFKGASQNDGAGPDGNLIVLSNMLYGTTMSGGPFSGQGTIFRVNTNGLGYAILYTFNGFNDGRAPNDLTLSGNTLYGTAASGAVSGFEGSVFSFNVTNQVFKNLHSFSGTPDGANLQGGVILVGNTLYGTAAFGGSANQGTLFSVNTDSTGFTNLHNFTAVSGTKSTNTDGSTPDCGLVYSGNTLYGMAFSGGLYGAGTIFTLSLPIVPPQLTITPAGTNVLLTWPANATGFTLEFATNLSPAVWNTNSTPPVILNQQDVVTNPISGTQMFYRLIQPSP